MNLLAFSGSLRAASTNTALLRAAARHAPEGMTVRIFTGLGELPIFNPDLEGKRTPMLVLRLAALVEAADGLLICSPEYAHGIPGGLKNAFDWLVSRFEVPDKPVLLFHASPRGDYVKAALTEVLNTMSVRLSPQGCVRVPLLGRTPEEMAAILSRPGVEAEIRQGLADFAAFIESPRND